MLPGASIEYSCYENMRKYSWGEALKISILTFKSPLSKPLISVVNKEFTVRMSEPVCLGEFRSGLIYYVKQWEPRVFLRGAVIGAAFSFVSFFVAVDKESDLPWVNHPLPQY